jgi:hypothetical protein
MQIAALNRPLSEQVKPLIDDTSCHVSSAEPPSDDGR